MENKSLHQHQHHAQQVTSLNKAFLIGIILNMAFVIAEAVAGFASNSLGLLSDAGHNLSDVVSLALAMMAYKLSGALATKKFTYGYKKSTILISLLNAIILCVAVIFIIVESIHKFVQPEMTKGNVISIVAAIGVVINGFTAYLFMRDRKKDLNIKGAFLHMAADALVSVGVVISGIVIYFTGWYIIDAIIGLAVSVIIIISTWELLSDSIRLALDGVPEQINYEQIVDDFRTVDGVLGMHHLHIWAISTTENALTAHVILRDVNKMEEVKTKLKEQLKADGIAHATLEFETENSACDGRCE